MDRITTLEHMILRTTPGKSDTFIYTVPKVNKVKAYCKLGKLEDIMEHFKINSIDQLVNILEAWQVVEKHLEYFPSDFYNGIPEDVIAMTSNIDRIDYPKVKKALEVKDND